LPGIQNTDPAVRNKAVKSLGLCCLRSIDLARERIVLLLQVGNLLTNVVSTSHFCIGQDPCASVGDLLVSGAILLLAMDLVDHVSVTHISTHLIPREFYACTMFLLLVFILENLV